MGPALVVNLDVVVEILLAFADLVTVLDGAGVCHTFMAVGVPDKTSLRCEELLAAIHRARK